MSEDMQGKVVLVAGASSGIGRATAEMFAMRGASVLLSARREDALSHVTDTIVSRGGVACFRGGDVSCAADVEAMVLSTVDAYGRIDICVNAAGIGGELAPIVDLTEEGWDNTLAINLKGAFFCIKYAARAMLAAGHGGAIVNVGSVASFLGFAAGSAYSSAKHGMIGLTSSASAELAPKDIRVNLVCPGVVDTPMHHQARQMLGDDLALPDIHLNRIAQPQEIARSILYLCSDESSFITGTTLTVDGGGTSTL
tara:strand:- start:124411 stop:125172 length:762 start_codon:yes stop_codon:yes gene_type:complete